MTSGDLKGQGSRSWPENVWDPLSQKW